MKTTTTYDALSNRRVHLTRHIAWLVLQIETKGGKELADKRHQQAEAVREANRVTAELEVMEESLRQAPSCLETARADLASIERQMDGMREAVERERKVKSVVSQMESVIAGMRKLGISEAMISQVFRERSTVCKTRSPE
ncbi:MAG: hypothetical protein E6Q97_07660 [Desulfurellales bacterium]|nr:MAG: hypothetical protein E6Q97_07660 [Desulfurellales bacterium]